MKAAIYSRKSKFTSTGDSIGNQIQKCVDYCNKNGISEYFFYEDEGFSGSTGNRPAFIKMLRDADSKKFNIVVCYRLDRISRNIGDFSNLIKKLQSKSIEFISVSEQFDTTSPVGRAMMYMASVFAQLERETIAERVRDNMLELAKSGRWLGGQTPLGFYSEKMSYIDSQYKEKYMYKLSPLPSELKIVSSIYEKYYELRSLSKVQNFLNTNNIKTKYGSNWTKNRIQQVLKNPLYVKSTLEIMNYLHTLGMITCGNPNGCGIVIYNKSKNIRNKRDINEWVAAVSMHKGIIEGDKWLQIQSILFKNKVKSPRTATGSFGIFSGLLFCSYCNSPLIIKTSHNLKYYCCSKKVKYGKEACDNFNVRVEILDNTIIQNIQNIKPFLLINYLENYKKDNQNTRQQILLNIEKKENTIKMLLRQIEENGESEESKYFLEEIKSLQLQIRELKESLSTIDNIPLQGNIQNEKIQEYIDNLSDFKLFIDKMENINNKRIFVSLFIKNVYWDGKKNIVNVRLLGE